MKDLMPDYGSIDGGWLRHLARDGVLWSMDIDQWHKIKKKKKSGVAY